MYDLQTNFHSHLAGNLRPDLLSFLNEFERYCATVICDECCVLYTHSYISNNVAHVRTKHGKYAFCTKKGRKYISGTYIVGNIYETVQQS